MSVLPEISPGQIEAFVSRRSAGLDEACAKVAPIIADVQARGDVAVQEWSQKFDGRVAPVVISRDEINSAWSACDKGLKRAIERAATNIRTFAEMQMPRDFRSETEPGVVVGQRILPLNRIGAYVPSGRFPLPSTVLMTIIPAKVAGVVEAVVVTPKVSPATLAACAVAEVDQVVEVGGAQAIAALAYGTSILQKVDKIVGPGSIYVAAAKRLVSADVPIDSVAGPTEVVIVADEGDPAVIAADLLAQAEHDPDASSILVTTSRKLADSVRTEVEKQLVGLSTERTARPAMEQNSAVVLTTSVDESMEVANRLAPEHLCLHDSKLLDQVTDAGGVFLGPHSAEAFGDYLTGPNHVLPTGGAARFRGGLSVLDFVKVVTYQEVSQEAADRLVEDTAILARAEGLEAHARSAESRRTKS